MLTRLTTVSVDYRVPLDQAVTRAMRKSKLLEPVWLLQDWCQGRLEAETREDELKMVSLCLLDLPEDKRFDENVQMQEMCIYLRRDGIHPATVRELLELVDKPLPSLEGVTVLALGTISTTLSVPALEIDRRGNRLIIPRKFSDNLLLCDRLLVFEPPNGTEF